MTKIWHDNKMHHKISSNNQKQTNIKWPKIKCVFTCKLWWTWAELSVRLYFEPRSSKRRLTLLLSSHVSGGWWWWCSRRLIPGDRKQRLPHRWYVSSLLCRPVLSSIAACALPPPAVMTGRMMANSELQPTFDFISTFLYSPSISALFLSPSTAQHLIFSHLFQIIVFSSKHLI